MPPDDRGAESSGIVLPEFREGDDERIQRVKNVAALTAIVLVEVTARRAHALPEQTEVAVKQEARGEAQLTDQQLNIAVRFTFKTDPHAFEVEAVFGLVYALTEAIEKEDADAFARHNALFNAWPYWRELVQNTTVRMGFPPPLVPLLKV